MYGRQTVGQVEHAVMSFGELLGHGRQVSFIAWNMTYDTGYGGYVLDLDKDVLQQGPPTSLARSPGMTTRTVKRLTAITPSRMACKVCRGRHITPPSHSRATRAGPWSMGTRGRRSSSCIA